MLFTTQSIVNNIIQYTTKGTGETKTFVNFPIQRRINLVEYFTKIKFSNANKKPSIIFDSSLVKLDQPILLIL